MSSTLPEAKTPTTPTPSPAADKKAADLAMPSSAVDLVTESANAWAQEDWEFKDDQQYYEATLKTYDIAFAVDPTDFYLLKRKADLLRYMGRYEEAIKHYNQWLSSGLAYSDPEKNLNLGRGFAFLGLNKFDEAKSILANEDCASGYVLLFQGKFAEAERIFDASQNKAKKGYSDEAPSKEERSFIATLGKNLALVLQKRPQATQIWNDFLLKPIPYYSFHKHEFYFLGGRILAKYGFNHEAQGCFTYALQTKREYLAASQEIEKLTQLPATFLSRLKPFKAADYWLQKGVKLSNQLRHLEALCCYNQALEKDSKNANAWCRKGMTLHALYRHTNTKAMECFDRALILDAKNSDALQHKREALTETWYHRAQVLDTLLVVGSDLHSPTFDALQEKRSKQQGKCHDQVLTLNPRDKSILLKAGRYDQVLGLDPKNKEAWVGKGHASSYLRSVSGHEQAAVCYEHALALDPDDTDIWSSQGHVLFALGQFEKALVCFDRRKTLLSTASDYCPDRMVTLTHLGQYTKAIAYDPAKKVEPARIPYAYISAYANAPAIAYDAKAIAYKPDRFLYAPPSPARGKGNNYNGFAFFCLGNLEGALAEFNSEQYHAIQYVSYKGYVLLLQGDSKSAEALFDNTLQNFQSSEDKPFAILGKGLLALSRQQLKIAEDHFQHADKGVAELKHADKSVAELSLILHFESGLPKKLRYYFVKGKMLAKLGFPEQAQMAFQQALKLKADYVPVLQEMEKLGHAVPVETKAIVPTAVVAVPESAALVQASVEPVPAAPEQALPPAEQFAAEVTVSAAPLPDSVSSDQIVEPQKSLDACDLSAAASKTKEGDDSATVIVTPAPVVAEDKTVYPIAFDAKLLQEFSAAITQQQEQKNIFTQMQFWQREAHSQREQLVLHQTELKELQGQMREVDGAALKVVQGRAEMLATMIAQSSAAQHAQAEREYISADKILGDFYFTIINQMTNSWLTAKEICKTKNWQDYEKENIDFLIGLVSNLPLPGAKLLQSALIEGRNRVKKPKIQLLATFLGRLVAGDDLIELVARRITLIKEADIRHLNVKKMGVIQQALQFLKDKTNELLANEIDSVVKEEAEKIAKKLLSAIMSGELGEHATAESADTLLAIVMGEGYRYCSPIAEETTVTTTVIQGKNYTAMMVDLAVAVPVSMQSFEEEQKLKAAQEEHRAQTKNLMERLEVLQTEMKEVKNKNKEKDTLVENLRRDITQLKADLEQDTSVSSGDSKMQLQMKRGALAAGTRGMGDVIDALHRSDAQQEGRLRQLEALVGTLAEQHALSPLAAPTIVVQKDDRQTLLDPLDFDDAYSASAQLV